MKSLAPLLLIVTAVSGAAWAWRAHIEAQDGRALAALTRPGDIRMMSSESCGHCSAARRWMQVQGVPFSECFIERDAQCAADYLALGAAGTPTLRVRGQTVLGLDRARLRDLLK